MKTLIIYDLDGNIIIQMYGTYKTPVGIPYLEIEMPSNKKLVNINVSITPNTPVFEDMPLSETDTLKKRIDEQEQAILELASMLGGAV